MMLLKDSFQAWLAKSDLARLQYAYAAVVLLALMAAGLIGLLNQGVARVILNVAGIAALALSVNLVAHALIKLLAAPQTPQTPTARQRKK